MSSDTTLDQEHNATRYRAMDAALVAAGIPEPCLDAIYEEMLRVGAPFTEMMFVDGVMAALAIRTPLNSAGYHFWKPRLAMSRDQWLLLLKTNGLEHEPYKGTIYDGGGLEQDLVAIELDRAHPNFHKGTGFIVREPEVVKAALVPVDVQSVYTIYATTEVMWSSDVARLLKKNGLEVVDAVSRYPDLKELFSRFSYVVACDGPPSSSNKWGLWTVGKRGNLKCEREIHYGGDPNSPICCIPAHAQVLGWNYSKDCS